MTTSDILDDLRSRILSRYTLLFLDTWEEERWESELAALAAELERGFVVWSATSGAQPPADGDSPCVAPLEFLERLDAYPAGHVFLLKDFHPYLSDPLVIRRLRDAMAQLTLDDKTLLLMGPDTPIPLELQRDSIRLRLPLPGLEELREILAAVLQERESSGGRRLEITSAQEERMLKAVLGLTLREARKALGQALFGKDEIDDAVYAALVSEKKHMVQGSDLLDFQELEEGVKDIGGLQSLKDWIARRAEAFSTRAQEQGIPFPKGVLLLGVQGCGKSLTSRAIAQLLSFPLVRLDVSNLLSSSLGSSERGMREVLNLMETIAPAVLWLDEIEKGFAGSGDSGQSATMSRIVGKFLTWMQEHRSPVFVVATANSVHDLPPEMLRRGRFDEMFFIDLPNYHERKQIFEIHLNRRGWKPEKYDVAALAEKTEGYSGAEIEQIVLSAMVEMFGQGRMLTQEDLDQAREQTVPLSVTMEEKIFELREWARTRCRPATPDSRVMQMLEQEHGHENPFGLDVDRDNEEEDDLAAAFEDAWIDLAENGQVTAALVEYVRYRDAVTFRQLQRDFSRYVDTEGEQGLALRSDPNVVLWLGLNQVLAEPLAKLINDRKLFLHPAELAAYDADGGGLKLPQLADLTDERAARPSWLPVCLKDVIPDGGVGRLGHVARMKLSRAGS